VVQSMWDATGSPSVVWAAQGHEFELADLRPQLSYPLEGLPHPLIPRHGQTSTPNPTSVLKPERAAPAHRA